ncbi:MAG: site-2 protease family protein [Cyanobacteria bacterium J06642_2]
MNGSLRVGTLFGIPFYIHPSWFLVLGLVTLSYGSGLANLFPASAGSLPWLLGLTAALLMFASVLAHELGHSFVAIAQGIEVKSITLFLFGGLASLDKESRTPAGAFGVAIAGPAVSLVLFALFSALKAISGLAVPLVALSGLLASVNLALALFNLIPGLPLDGGNILKALIWQVTDNPYKGTKLAARAGQAFGWLAVAAGVIPWLTTGSFGNFWYAVIGWFLLRNADRAAQSADLSDRMSQLTAADAVTPDSPIVSEQLTLRQFANTYVIGKMTWRQYLVTNLEGQLTGTLSVNDLKRIPVETWPQVEVKELMRPYENKTTIAADASLLDAVKALEERKLSELSVLDHEGQLLGLLEKTAIPELLRSRGSGRSALSSELQAQ